METSVVKIITYVTYFSSSKSFFYLYLSMIKMLLKRLLKIGKSHQYKQKRSELHANIIPDIHLNI